MNKISTASKDLAMSPTPPAAEPERTELLGSLTTQQQQRTSARVIKKLRLEPVVDKDKKSKRPDGQPDDLTECETPNKIDDKDPLKFPTVKQRMPKALWSTDEKNLFFEALNEYGKDFDAITAYICAKMKKKGMPDVNLKTKTQVSHFYYRTWHKLSKHVHFDENVKKVAQELYALINYGELRKKLSCVSEKTCARLGEMVRCGSIAVRARGRNLRVRTPACRALRNLNQITERLYYSRVCGRACCVLRARDAGAWARVQAAAHNPRAHVALPLRTRLAALIHALSERWTPPSYYKPESATTDKFVDEQSKEMDEGSEAAVDRDEEIHLNMETDRMIVQEQKLLKKPVLHVGPKPNAEIHLPVVNPSEQLSSQKICFSSYLERMCSQRPDKDGGSKIRTPKRQRKDSTTEKDKEAEQKKFKSDDDVNKLMHIDETAIDGIELMANYKNILEDEEKPSAEDGDDEKELKSEETADEAEIVPDKDIERDKDVEREKDISERDMLERDKDSFSEMEDDEKYAKSDTDNESDQGKNDKTGKTKFKNLKVKFRIRPKKRGGSIYTLVIEKDQENQESKPDEPKSEEEPKPDIDVEMAIQQIRKGWSEYDAGDLMIGDLYLMFGSRSKLELDYWWAEPTPPLPQPPQKSAKPDLLDKDKHIDKKEKVDGVVEESDIDVFSPKHAFSHDSNDALSGDERKGEQLASPEHKSSAGSSSFKLVSKLINRPQPSPSTNQAGMSLVSERLKRLLAMVGNPHVGPSTSAAPARCGCGGVCPHRRQPQQKQPSYGPSQVPPPTVEPAAPVFRHPTPIAPKPDTELQKTMNVAGVPRWRRGRPRLADRRVVVQRLLPLLPKLPPPNNLIPVKIVPNSPPAPPKILPKPPPTSTSDLSFFYVLSESNGQFYFHDGDRRIPITPMPNTDASPQDASVKDVKSEIQVNADSTGVTDGVESTSNGVTDSDQTEQKEAKSKVETKEANSLSNGDKKPESADIGNFLPTESMSLSPSRLLRETEGWFEGSVQDFSLSSFLGHLEGRVQPELAVDSQLHSLMAESSVDYVAKFADLAAEVTDEVNHLNDDLT
ncbi:hypothetical protein ABMA27_003493 [Loxostege sticticalis]|uniref:SANT domain-containing protein n=1 Tax=Loxostege sticticalis TaxID=481309 RepID=A0ABR3HTB3_LOXSC